MIERDSAREPGGSPEEELPGESRHVLSALRRHFWGVPTLALALGCAASLLLARNARQSADRAAEQEFLFATEEIRWNILNRMSANAQILRSGATLFEVQPGRVDRRTWHDFATGLQVERFLPGTLGLGFAPYVEGKGLVAHEKAVRAEGMAYAVRPAGKRDGYGPVLYLEPFTGRNLRAFGFDMLSEPVRRKAMLRARDSGTFSLSGRVTLVQENGKDVQTGTLLYHPVYRRGMPLDDVAQRRKAFVGWVYSPYRMRDLMHGILGDRSAAGGELPIRLEIYDGASTRPEDRLYASGDPSGARVPETSPPRHRRFSDVRIGGNLWRLEFRSERERRGFAKYREAWLMLGGGCFISLLLAGLLLVMGRTRARAMHMARKLTRELRESEDSYRQQFVGNSSVMLLVEPNEGAILDANLAAERFYGHAREQLQMMWIGELDAGGEGSGADGASPGLAEGSVRTVHRLRDGTLRDVDISVSRLRLGAREFLHVIVHDVTEQVRSEELRQHMTERLALAARAGGVGIWEFDLVQNSLLWDGQMYRLYGIAPGRDLSPYDAWAAGMHPDDAAANAEAIQAAIRGEKEFDTRFRVVWPDGSVHHIRALGMVVRDASGEAVQMIGTNWDITDQMEKEALFLRLEAQRRLAMDLSRLASWEFDVSTGLFHFGEEFYGLFGTDREEQGGTLMTPEVYAGRFVHPEEVAVVGQEIAIALSSSESGLTRQLEHRALKADGTPMHLQVRYTVIRDDAGKVVRLVGANQDVTERKRAEQALRQSEETLRSYIENAPDGIFIADAQGVYTGVNPAACAMLGCPSEEIVGAGILSLLHPDSLGLAREAFVRLQEDGWCRVELSVVRRDGSFFPALLSAVALEDGQSMGFLKDISEIRQAEQELRENERQISRLLQTTDQGIYGIDTEGRCTFINRAGLRMLGYEREECLGQVIHSLIHHSHPDGSTYATEDCPIFRAKATGTAARVDDECFWRKDGTSFPVEYSSYPIMEEECIRGAVVTFNDIGARKQAEAELIRAKENAEAANAAKSEFLANMSHEIRTPMNGIMGMTGLLLDTPLGEEQRRFAEIVRSSGEALLALVNDILDFSKVEAGKLELEMLDFDLRSLLDDLGASQALRAQQKGLEFVCAIMPSFPTALRGDPGRLRQILLNLVGNAIKFTQQGEIVMRVDLISQTEEEAIIWFSISDTGIGIPKDKQDKLFQKFTQVDASTTRQYGGTGLGLAICRQLTELMGGEIGVVSEEGKGADFWFTARFPLQAHAGQDGLEEPDLGGTRILLVEDNAATGDVLEAQLASWNARVTTVPDGPRALKALYAARDGRDPFRIALLDQTLPGMDGEMLGRMVRGNPGLEGTALLLLTTVARSGEAKRVEDLGFVGSLPKPVRRTELMAYLMGILGRAELPRGGGEEEGDRRLRQQPVRILLAEDNFTNQLVALGMLKNLGLRADAVGNGLEALQTLRNVPYDLVLMDCQMPEMDGFEATRRIRSELLGANREIPIVAMTANAMAGDKERCLSVGMTDFVSKPVDPAMLARVLDKWLPKGTLPQAMEESAAGEDAGEGMQVFDREGFSRRMMGDASLVAKVLEAFKADLPLQLATLRRAVVEGDCAASSAAAHRLRGAAANVGADSLAQVARAMENAGLAADLAGVREGLSRLEAAWVRLERELG